MILKDVNRRVKNVPEDTNKELEPIKDEFITSLFNNIQEDDSNPLEYYSKNEVDNKIVQIRQELVSALNLTKLELEKSKTEIAILKEKSIITPKEISPVEGKLQLTQDKVQFCTNINTVTQIILPIVLNTPYLEVKLNFLVENNVPQITFPKDIKWQATPKIEVNKTYELIFTYTNGIWLGGWVVYA